VANNVAYHCYVTSRMADHVRHKYPKKVIIATIQGYSTWGKSFTEEEKTYLVELSKSVDCLFDQGHRGTYIPRPSGLDLYQRLQCAYGTSEGSGCTPPNDGSGADGFCRMRYERGSISRNSNAAGGEGSCTIRVPWLIRARS